MVPEGSEQAAAATIHAAYRHSLFYEWDHVQQRRDFPPWERPFFCTPNSLLSLGASAPAGPADIALAADHMVYASLIGFPAAITPTRAPTVVVLDTGVAPSAGITPTAERNFLDGAANPASADDDSGHGTTVAAIIHDLVPQAELIVYKVADANGHASEWDVLAALGASYEADVVNMSLVFGLTTRRCPMCGVKSGSSRSAVFGYLLDELARRELHRLSSPRPGTMARVTSSTPLGLLTCLRQARSPRTSRSRASATTEIPITHSVPTHADLCSLEAAPELPAMRSTSQPV